MLVVMNNNLLDMSNDEIMTGIWNELSEEQKRIVCDYSGKILIGYWLDLDANSGIMSYKK